jgi:hypothetical protein
VLRGSLGWRAAGSDATIAFHEYFHVFQNASITTGDAGTRRDAMGPIWFAEGTAEFMAQLATQQVRAPESASPELRPGLGVRGAGPCGRRQPAARSSGTRRRLPLGCNASLPAGVRCGRSTAMGSRSGRSVTTRRARWPPTCATHYAASHRHTYQ